VLVLVDDDTPESDLDDVIAELMAPYSETLEVESRDDEAYDAERVIKVRQQYIEYAEKNEDVRETREQILEMDPSKLIESWTDQKFRIDEQGVIHTQTTYNPRSKWDWYQTGGRFSSRAPLLFGGEQDCDGRLSDIDWDTIRERARLAAIEAFDTYEKATRHIEPIATWESVRGRHEADGTGIDGAREEYRTHPWVVAIGEAFDHMYFFGTDLHDYFHVGQENAREEFIANKVAEAGVYYSVVTPDGEWHSKGDMGWWGMDTVTDADWTTTFHKELQALPQTTFFRLLDVHI